MTKTTWGLLGPETIYSERRTRTLGVAAAVRAFNDLAVPGMGGLWFGKQLLLAILGIATAERLRNSRKNIQNIEVANAVEALACLVALQSNGWKSDARLRGAMKLKGKKDFQFSSVRKKTFYVTQPMRTATVQPLSSLGLVYEGTERFNAFSCTDTADKFIKCACDESEPSGRRQTVLEHLVRWTEGTPSSPSFDRLDVLSPLTSLPRNARDFLHHLLVTGAGENGARRRTALKWVEELQTLPEKKIDWSEKPQILSNEHWQDLHSGALFFAARNAALAALEQVEILLSNHEPRLSIDGRLPESVTEELQRLRECGKAFLMMEHDRSPELIASTFCRDCADSDNVTVLSNIVARDERVLRLRERIILPGPAFQHLRNMEDAPPEEDNSEAPTLNTMNLPKGISHRIRNLFYLNLDLNDKLTDWLKEPSGEANIVYE